MKKIIENALLVADSAELYVREVTSTSVSMRLGEIKEVAGEKKLEVALRLVKDGNMGVAVATQLEDPTLIERALVSLKHQKSPAECFENRELSDYDTALGVDQAVKEMTTDQLVALVDQTSKRLKVMAPDVSTGVYASKTFKRVWLLNSAGFDSAFNQTHLALGISTITPQGFHGAGKEFAGGGMPVVLDRHLQELITLHRLGEKPVSLGNEKLPVIFAGRAMGSLMMRVLGGVHGGNVLKGVSPLAGKLGEQLFSDKLTIVDDGRFKLGINTRPFDDEGQAIQSTCLYEAGVLKCYLSSPAQEKKFLDQLNVVQRPTGNSFKRALFSQEIEDAPSIFETNLRVMGPLTDDDALIASVSRGLLITGVMGAHTGNINGGEFSLNISSGYLIENGQLVGKVQGSMIAGNIYQFFKEVEAIGTEVEPMRSIFYHMGYSPMVLFKSASIVGK